MEATEVSPRRLLRPKQAAEMLNLDPRTLARWAATGKLTVLRIGATGKHRRYYADEVEALLAGEPGPGSST